MEAHRSSPAPAPKVPIAPVDAPRAAGADQAQSPGQDVAQATPRILARLRDNRPGATKVYVTAENRAAAQSARRRGEPSGPPQDAVTGH